VPVLIREAGGQTHHELFTVIQDCQFSSVSWPICCSNHPPYCSDRQSCNRIKLPCSKTTWWHV